MDGLKQNAGPAIVAAGAAIVAFGVDAANAFSDTAKAAIDLGTATGLVVVRIKQRRAALESLGGAAPHPMDADEFERFLAALCRRDGCRDVQVGGGAGDLAADVLYTDPSGRRGLIQAKRYARGNSVGSDHVQRVNGTYRDFHGCSHASIVTTSHFTPAARTAAAHINMPLLDEHRLTNWMNGQRNAAPWN